MNDAVRYTKAFAKALAEHLRGNVPAFTDVRTGSGGCETCGCETCGYGASEYDVVDMDRLEAEIDKFAAEFKKKV